MENTPYSPRIHLAFYPLQGLGFSAPVATVLRLVYGATESAVFGAGRNASLRHRVTSRLTFCAPALRQCFEFCWERRYLRAIPYFSRLPCPLESIVRGSVIWRRPSERCCRTSALHSRSTQQGAFPRHSRPLGQPRGVLVTNDILGPSARSLRLSSKSASAHFGAYWLLIC